MSDFCKRCGSFSVWGRAHECRCVPFLVFVPKWDVGDRLDDWSSVYAHTHDEAAEKVVERDCDWEGEPDTTRVFVQDADELHVLDVKREYEVSIVAIEVAL